MTDRAERAAPRMEPLATLPVFFKLQDRRVVLVGGGEPAVWKADLLQATGAIVDVMAVAPCEGLQRLAQQPASRLRLIRRPWSPNDLVGAALVIGDIEDQDEAAAFRRAAVAAGVPVNVVDKPAFCDFQFGTVVARSPLVIGISTDGGAPVFGQALRTRIESLLPTASQAWAQASKDWRPLVQKRNWGFRQRRRFWEAFTDRALQADRPPDIADQAACFAAAEHEGGASSGSIMLVGCGPGTLDGLTFGAVRALQSADVVVHDSDVPGQIVGLARREAHKIPTPIEERDACGLIREFSEAGRYVAWLGTGNALGDDRWDRRALQFIGLASPLARLAGLCAGSPNETLHGEADATKRAPR